VDEHPGVQRGRLLERLRWWLGRDDGCRFVPRRGAAGCDGHGHGHERRRRGWGRDPGRGSVHISTAQSKFGGASGLFNGSTDFLTLATTPDWNFAGGDFTIEAFISCPNGMTTQIPVFFSHWGPADAGLGWQFLFDHNSGLLPANSYGFTFSTTGADTNHYSVSYPSPGSSWHHVAVTRSVSSFRFYVDGTQQGATINMGSKVLYASGSPLALGVGIDTDGGPNPVSYFDGYIDEVRITKGVARYTQDFTPPTAAFPDQ
jgi:hypothetical protein